MTQDDFLEKLQDKLELPAGKVQDHGALGSAAVISAASCWAPEDGASAEPKEPTIRKAIVGREEDGHFIDKLDFGIALSAMKAGFRFSREGWNGKGMWVFIANESGGEPITPAAAKKFGMPIGSKVNVLPYLMMRTVQGSFVPWIASQTDLLAEDWFCLAD